MDASSKRPVTSNSVFAALTGLLRQIGWRILLGLAGAIVLLWLFGLLADEIFENEFTSLDNGFERWVHSFANPVLDAVFGFFTTLGSIVGVLVLTVIIFGVLVWRKHLHSAWLVGLAVAGGVVLNQALKFFFHRPRPELWPVTAPRPTTFSFPSGHATVSFCLCGVLIWLGWRFIRPAVWRIVWTILLSFFILMVGLSRIYFGVHYPTDVLGGYISGAFWLVTFLSGVAAYDRWHRRSFFGSLKF